MIEVLLRHSDFDKILFYKFVMFILFLFCTFGNK